MTKTVLLRSLRTRQILFGVLVCVLVLSACRRTPEPTPTAAPTASQTGISTQAASPEPSPSRPVETLAVTAPSATPQPTVGTPIATAYPGPSTPFPSPTSPYPGPATPFPSPTSPYPGPATPFPSPTSPYPGPGPGVTPLPSATPYPGPGGTVPTQLPSDRPGYPAPGTPTAAASPGVVPSPSPPSAGPTTTLAPTATQGVLRTRIQATDPRTFQPVSGQPQLVEFFAFWDPVSLSMAPVVHVLEDRYQDRIRFVYLDIDDPANSLYKALIGSRIPPLFFLLDEQGNVVEEWRGRVAAEDFERAFATLPP